MIKDHASRQQALDPRQSFIVQAPAGSGKTELLTQRFLVLLALVRAHPEEVVAITFTRKAASEMRARIFEAIQLAANEPPPQQSHLLQTWHLAKNVLARDHKEGWHLLQNPNRLRVTTIDSLCARIARAAPLQTHFGTMPKIIENPQPYYSEAAQRLLASLEQETSWQQFLATLLLHLDNNYAIAVELFVGMLQRRDQWLTYIMNHRHETARQVLEQALKNIIVETLSKAEVLLPTPARAELQTLLDFASANLPTTACGYLEPCFDKLNAWQGMAKLLLNKDYEWRRAVNKSCGFPAATDSKCQTERQLYKNMKQRMMTLLTKLSDNEVLRQTLAAILLLPPPNYSEQQWQIVNALITLLPILVAHLNMLFREQNVTDFIAIAEAATYALEDHDELSDIKLNLDYQIQHLLVDEFQDTSATQYRLLRLLTAGWENQDGRTLFLVGDPMQSIYRFREAEVGLFLKVKNNGLGNVSLRPLRLAVNFRSVPGIVNWCNAVFKDVLPQQENAELGAIPFAPSEAFSEKQALMPVCIHPLVNHTRYDEAQYISELVNNELQQHPHHSIAILVRSRTHLEQVIPQLKKAAIKFQAVEIAALFASAVIQDLFALTRALTHLGDRIAWLSVLRAPWCGLCLADLYLIANYHKHNTLFESLQNFATITSLSETAQIRLQRIVPILSHAIQNRARGSIKTWLADTWYALGGPACAVAEYELLNAEIYFDLLDEFCGNLDIDLQLLADKLQCSYSQITSPEARVHLMTIHKAKGLEFDVVIIPALERKPAVDSNRLLLWLERENSQAQLDLLLAPIKAKDQKNDPIYKYIKSQEALKTQYEVARLLYVAITRAKCQLHLLASSKAPAPGSFLALLWPYIHEKFSDSKQEQSVLAQNQQSPVIKLSRLQQNWQFPDNIAMQQNQTTIITKNSLVWSNAYQAHMGTVIHELLQVISSKGASILPGIMAKQYLQKKLLQLGVLQKNIENCCDIIKGALQRTLSDKRGQWILSTQHNEAHSELSLKFTLDNTVVHYVIDRTFV
jgi:ATP-dependent helicase/nuclease subunit A